MANTTRLARVLVIVFGAYRSFDRTCDSIVRNIVAPNAPHVKIILSIDEEKSLLLNELAGDCLAPYAESLVVLADQEKLRNGVPPEFTLVERALKHIQDLNETFDFMIKVRTDLQANVAMPPMAHIYGEVGVVSHLNRNARRERFSRFLESLRSLYKAKLGRSPTSGETARAFILTAGMSEFLDTMLFHPHPSPFSLGDHEFLRKNLEDALRSYESEGSFLKIIRKIHQSYPVAYLIGSTWLNFGRYDSMKTLSLSLVKLFGTLTWGEYGFDDSDGRRVNGFVVVGKWLKVTESQMRLAHKRVKIDLVDLVNYPDYEKSFNASDDSRLSVDNKNPKLYFYILRDCTRAKYRAECKVYKNGRQPYVDKDLQYRKNQCEKIRRDFSVISGTSWGTAPDFVRRMWILVYRCDHLKTPHNFSPEALRKCNQLMMDYDVKIGASWGRLPPNLQVTWRNTYHCDELLRYEGL